MKMLKEIKNEIGWKENIDVVFLAKRVMELCDNIRFMEHRIGDLEDTIHVMVEEKDIMSSVELYKDAGR